MIDPTAPNGIQFPSFVQCEPGLRPYELPEIISHWNPVRSGSDTIDAKAGIANFDAAILFAQRTTGPFFLINVLEDIRQGDRLGAIEFAFLNAMAGRATAGGKPRVSSDDEVAAAAVEFGADEETIREVEQSVHSLLGLANSTRDPQQVADLLFDWMHGKRHWTCSVIAYAICSAALKGTFH